MGCHPSFLGMVVTPAHPVFKTLLTFYIVDIVSPLLVEGGILCCTLFRIISTTKSIPQNLNDTTIIHLKFFFGCYSSSPLHLAMYVVGAFGHGSDSRGAHFQGKFILKKQLYLFSSLNLILEFKCVLMF